MSTRATQPRIGIGVSDFRKLRERDLLFIDKSMFLAEVMDTGAEILLLPRPRRFGKTLNLSMLRYFLERQQDRQQKKRHARLFEGLAISATQSFTEHFARYPVIFLTFKDIKERDFSESLFDLQRLMRAEIVRLAGDGCADTAAQDQVTHGLVPGSSKGQQETQLGLNFSRGNSASPGPWLGGPR